MNSFLGLIAFFYLSCLAPFFLPKKLFKLKTEYSNKSNFSGKIVSLLASTTEIICALGLKENLVGISHECDNPEFILNLPRCSSPKIDINQKSKDIDIAVENNVMDGLSIYKIDNEVLKSLKPDLIFTQDMCKVCAINPSDLTEFLKEITNQNVKIVSYSPNSLNEIINEIKQIGEILECKDASLALITDLKIRIKTFREENLKRKFNPKVAFIEWIDPIYFGGNWMPELIELAGGTPVFGQSGFHSSIISFEEIINSDPDCILIAPCGFDIERTLKELDPFVSRPEWKFLKAVRKNMVFVLDGNRYFNRPGMSIINSIEMIAEIIHPEKFIYEYENVGWVRLIN